jgi:hypothetical protein
MHERSKSSTDSPGAAPHLLCYPWFVEDAKSRAERRRQQSEQWPVRVYRLGAEPNVDPLDRSTVDERIASMWPLARAAWSVAGKPIPDYARRDTPGMLIRARVPS